ncbi:MAG TPA: AraC family transcriptional regulator [Abditibacteriaceae bacterium]|jgi:AraC-like DNA-binding protein
MNRTASPRLLFRNDAPSALGRISMAGFLPQSGGTGHGKLRVLGSYALVYVLDGGGVYRDSLRYQQKIGRGDLIVLCPGIAHSYGPERGNDWTELHVVFDGPVFDLWREAEILDQRRPIWHLEPVDEWAKRIEPFVTATRPVTPAARALELARLLECLTDMFAHATPHAGESHEHGWLERACYELEMNLERDIDLENVAKDLGFSYENFRKLFQKYSGISPARYRASRVIDAACVMLQNGDLTNKEVARRLGFSDEYYFSKRFKQITGVTPREFRRSLPNMAEPQTAAPQMAEPGGAAPVE